MRSCTRRTNSCASGASARECGRGSNCGASWPPARTGFPPLDQLINEAAERGAFDHLPGAGKPLPRRDETDAGQAWLRDYLRREGVPAEEMLPAPFRLRKEAERLAESLPAMSSEQEVREAVTNLNQRIRDWRRFPLDSPIFVALVDEAAMVSRWQQAQSAMPDGQR